MSKISARVNALLSDAVRQMDIHDTITVWELAGMVNRHLRISTVSTATVSAWCRMNGLVRVAVGEYEKVGNL